MDALKKIKKETEYEKNSKRTGKNARTRRWKYKAVKDKDGKLIYKVGKEISKDSDGYARDVAYADLHTIPTDIRDSKLDECKTRGYNYLPPKEWYKVPAHPPNCITDKRSPTIPTLTYGVPFSALDWYDEIEKEEDFPVIDSPEYHELKVSCKKHSSSIDDLVALFKKMVKILKKQLTFVKVNKILIFKK